MISAHYYTILYYTILYYTILYYTILYLYYTILYYTILYYTILYYTNYTILCYTIIYTTLHYTIQEKLYYTFKTLEGFPRCVSSKWLGVGLRLLGAAEHSKLRPLGMGLAIRGSRMVQQLSPASPKTGFTVLEL